MIDLSPQHLNPPALEAPAPLLEVKRRRGRDRDRDNAAGRSNLPSWIFVGAVLILTDDDGSQRECTVVHVDPSTGVYFCDGDRNAYISN
jgi:hypothetical protein